MLSAARRLRDEQSLSAVTEYLCRRLDVQHRIAPMSDDPVPTRVHTTDGALDFQDYFVRQRAQPTVVRLEYAGAANARMSPALRTCLENAALRAIIICPSNPYLSIAPILAVQACVMPLRMRACRDSRFLRSLEVGR